MTPLGEMIWDALMARGQAEGTYYGYTDLARDVSDVLGKSVASSYLRNIVAGERRHPSAEIVHAITRALRPYLNEERAMVLAGYALDEWRDAVAQANRTERTARRVASLPQEQARAAVAAEVQLLDQAWRRARAAVARMVGYGDDEPDADAPHPATPSGPRPSRPPRPRPSPQG